MLLLTNRKEQATIHDLYIKHTFVTEDSAGGAAAGSGSGSGSGSFMGDKMILPTFLRS